MSEKRKFTKEYKQEALEHWKSSGRGAATVAAELGIRAPLLCCKQALRTDPVAGTRN
ncbi:hypothetical protein [Ereboglobus luteus]|uniref:hypothetical protein n=1 Tax=Ereboglobus luteus TaxID=1796921 RepID=UPI001F2419B1|nr:hypothetical protein [Ereboglobus luteus]